MYAHWPADAAVPAENETRKLSKGARTTERLSRLYLQPWINVVKDICEQHERVFCEKMDTVQLKTAMADSPWSVNGKSVKSQGFDLCFHLSLKLNRLHTWSFAHCVFSLLMAAHFFCYLDFEVKETAVFISSSGGLQVELCGASWLG